jgi:acyl-CoA thioester hydrolase
MDALGHINNAMYFRYMESARVAYLSKIGILLGHDNQSFVLANTMCNFILPISYPANLTIETYVSKLGNSSVDFIHKFINNDKKDEITAIGLATAVWVNLIKNKAIALPKQIRDKLNRAT